MLKKSVLIASVIALIGCGSSQYSTYSSKPKYKISDEDTRRWIVEGNKFEQCLFPKEYSKGTFNRLSDEEKYLHDIFVYGKSLENTIGSIHSQTIFNDRPSFNYLFVQQFPKFNHSKKVAFDKQWCETVKKEYKQSLTQVKAEVKKAKERELARQKQEEKERKARADYYASPQGQADLARQQYQQALLAQQRAYEHALAEQRQQQDFQNFTNTLNQSISGITNSMNQRANLINSMANSMPRYQYQPPQNSSTTCYRLANGIVRCNHQ
ncbi:MAG: DUF5358 family protein [Pasteurellaceae bacterium]|nr:DUF5358 family protein [Pasteurellaceae bacterium]